MSYSIKPTSRGDYTATAKYLATCYLKSGGTVANAYNQTEIAEVKPTSSSGGITSAFSGTLDLTFTPTSAGTAHGCPSGTESLTLSGAACPTWNFSAKSSTKFGSRAVLFTVTAPRKASLTWSFGDGQVATLPDVTHIYAHDGEYDVSLTGSLDGCPTVHRVETVVADPVTTYAPTVHLATGEPVQPDSIKPFVDHALLIRDKPQLDKTKPNSDLYPGCADTVVAAGSALLTKSHHLKSGEGTPAKKRASVPKSIPGLSVKRLSGKGAAPYIATASFWDVTSYPSPGAFTYKCSKLKGSKTSSASASGTKKNPTDDGFVLSLAAIAGHEPKLTGNTAAAPFYIVYKPAKLVEYWFFYPANMWSFGPVTERHEGDWEHIVVRLDGPNKTMDKVAYYQHYCVGQSKSRTSLALDSSTHPPVWAAKGGHASYSTNVGTDKVGACFSEGLKGVGQGVGDHTSAGVIWRPWTDPDRLVNARAEAWYGTQVAWGDAIASTFANYGPKAPGANKYSLPASW